MTACPPSHQSTLTQWSARKNFVHSWDKTWSLSTNQRFWLEAHSHGYPSTPQGHNRPQICCPKREKTKHIKGIPQHGHMFNHLQLVPSAWGHGWFNIETRDVCLLNTTCGVEPACDRKKWKKVKSACTCVSPACVCLSCHSSYITRYVFDRSNWDFRARAAET